MAKRLVVGNWKMNPATRSRAVKLLRGVGAAARKTKRVEVVICPPHVFLSLPIPSSLTLGAQDLFYGDVGPHTGEISGAMLKDTGVKYVIIGHSERRREGESDGEIHLKLKSALSLGFAPILCVGEEMRDGDGQYLHTIKGQLMSALSGISKNILSKVVLAYEPVWAVGKTAERALPPEDAREMNLFLRKIFADMAGEEKAKKIKVLYGGSVDGKNAGKFLSVGKMDGLLVGRQSLDPKKFLEILRAANDA